MKPGGSRQPRPERSVHHHGPLRDPLDPGPDEFDSNEPEPRRGDRPPGTETEEHYHPRSEEIYYVLRGQGLMILEGERREVGPGDGILIPPGARHSIRNIAQDPLVFLCCCSPPYGHEDTVLVE